MPRDALTDWVIGQGRGLRSLGRWLSLPMQAARRDRRPGVVVLLYHRVGGGTRSDVDVAAPVFEEQMRVLHQECRVVSLDEIAERGMRGEAEWPDRDVVAITFDDGYRDVYDVAYPVLRRYGLPATIYVPPMYIETQRPFDFGAHRKTAAYRRPMPLTWDQAGEMMRSGLIAIGSHTQTHMDLSRATEEEAARELEECDRTIERRLGVTPKHFAYPWGRWSAVAERLAVRRYATVALGGPAKNPHATLDPHRLWRFPVLRTDGVRLFRARMRALAASRRPVGSRHVSPRPVLRSPES